MSEENLQSIQEKKLLSEQYEAFCDALEVLFIQGNPSGRLKFAENWPAAAVHLFGEDLLKYDREGVEDKDRRAQLEEEAEERRIALVQLAETLEEKSADKGVLQTGFVQSVFETLGRDVALLLYAPDIVERFAGAAPAPPPPPEPEPEAESPPPPEPEPEPAKPEIRLREIWAQAMQRRDEQTQ